MSDYDYPTLSDDRNIATKWVAAFLVAVILFGGLGTVTYLVVTAL